MPAVVDVQLRARDQPGASAGRSTSGMIGSSSPPSTSAGWREQRQERQARPAGRRRPAGSSSRASGPDRVVACSRCAPSPGSVRMRAAVDLGGDRWRRTPGRGAAAGSSSWPARCGRAGHHQRRRCRWPPAPRAAPGGGTARASCWASAAAPRQAEHVELAVAEPADQRGHPRRQRRRGEYGNGGSGEPPTPGTSKRITPRSGSSASTNGWSASRLAPIPLHSSSGGASTKRPRPGRHARRVRHAAHRDGAEPVAAQRSRT